MVTTDAMMETIRQPGLQWATPVEINTPSVQHLG